MTTLMPLPTFIIAGERKSGTTALHSWMSCHPDVFMHPHWDMNYFLDDAVMTRVWIEGEVNTSQWENTHSLPAYSEIFSEGAGRKAIGEKTADLFFWRPAHMRLARYLPDCRYIIILRNAVDRAWSHYWNEIGKTGRENLSFEEALAQEEIRSSSSAYARMHFSYLARGFYDVTLRAFYQSIPPDRVLVITAEQMRLKPAETLSDVYRFIGVNPDLGLERAGTRHNENATQIPRSLGKSSAIKPLTDAYNRMTASLAFRLGSSPEQVTKLKILFQQPFRKPASKVTMPESIRAKLYGIYAPHIERLEALLGRKFVEWKACSNNPNSVNAGEHLVGQ